MGFFNFIETFFFISLAITFVLIMMLVYHFKERLTTLEKKTETIMDIMNGFFKEISVIKTLCLQSASLTQLNNPIISNQKILVSDTDSDYDTDSEYEDQDDDSVEVIEHIHIHSINTPIYPEINEFEIIEPTLEEDPNELNIEVEIESDEEPEPLEEVTSIITEQLDLIIDTIEIEEKEKEEEEQEEQEEQEKEEQQEEEEQEKEEQQEEETPILSFDDYKKMDISDLRTLVIQKGLVSDTKKMKKNELIRMLTTAE